MQFNLDDLNILRQALIELEKGYTGLPDFDTAGNDHEKMSSILVETAKRMQDNYPYFHPLYAGQMLKPPHTIARLAYMLALWINPNNHALDGGKASSVMEKEAIANLASLFGWDIHLGHICGGGTMANMEALWVSGKLSPSKRILASEMAHYTHSRLSEVLGLNFNVIECDHNARMDISALEREIQCGDVGTVVVTMGTTATASVDPLQKIVKLKEKYNFRLHVDAAYGGYFILASNLDHDTRAAFDCIARADSIAIDPHKHGLQPYGCGCILYKDPSVGILYKHDSPYTYFTSSDLHLGEISLECSRPGAAATALWATQKMFPMNKSGEFAINLGKCRDAAIMLYNKLQKDNRFITFMKPELDIVVWAPKAVKASHISELSNKVFELSAHNNLHLAVCRLSSRLLKPYLRNVEIDRDYITVLRSCLMKPEHICWIDKIWELLSTATEDAFKTFKLN